jgi:MFS transporter, DHA1 family, multidrug resistance protein
MDPWGAEPACPAPRGFWHHAARMSAVPPALPPGPALTRFQRTFAFLLITGASVLGFAATDLILPAIPALPQLLGGTPTQAQWVLAAYGLGFAAGLLLAGELGARWSQRRVLAGLLVLLAASSAAAGTAESVAGLTAWRVLQGLSGAAAATFAPGIIRTVFDDRQALRAIGLQGSLEALIPALAPIAGAWLLAQFSWRASFFLLAACALVAAAAMAMLPAGAFPAPGRGRAGSYRALLRNPAYLRQGLSHACSLGALLVLVFGAPAVMVHAMGGAITDFITMQCMGVASFVVAANASSALCRRFGAARVILAGSAVSAAGTWLLLAYGVAGGRTPLVMAALFVPVNLGFGLRGPAGFFQAIVAAGGDDSRAAAGVILAILLVAAGGTVAVAPWIATGLLPLALAAATLSTASVVMLFTGRPGLSVLTDK